MKRNLQEIMKKKNNTWNIRPLVLLSHRPNDPAYYIANWRIFVLEQSRNFPSEKWRKTVVFFVCLTFIRAYDTIILMNRVDIWLNYLFLFHWEICTTILLHSKGQKFWQFFCSYFGRNDDFINSFWNLLTFSGLGQVWKIWL